MWGSATALLLVSIAVISSQFFSEAQLSLRASDADARLGALVATWLGLVLLTWRTGGRTLIVAIFAAAVLGFAGAFPEPWAQAAAAVTAGTAYGLLGMVMTRPASGLRVFRELAVSAVLGLIGAVVVYGYDVDLRPYRFRVMVLGLVLAGALALAWRLGQGFGSLGRRGVVLIASGVTALVLTMIYTEAVRRWGTAELLDALVQAKRSVRDTLGADPRLIELLVGFPALVWGVAVRDRRRQGWWMCAFGALGAAGLTSSLIDPSRTLGGSFAATGYGVLFGGLLGLVVMGLDRLVTGPGGRRVRTPTGEAAHRPEPTRQSRVL